MNVLIGVISPAAAWIIPRTSVEELRRVFLQHTFLEAWDAETLRRLMKRGAWLINIGRGKLVDDVALVAALQSGHLGGAALDVLAHEPLDPDSSYWDPPNVIVTPHTSGTIEDYWTPLVALFSENLRRFEAGRPLLNVVDKEAGY